MPGVDELRRVQEWLKSGGVDPARAMLGPDGTVKVRLAHLHGAKLDHARRAIGEVHRRSESAKTR
jgi:hypothetical protein